MFNELLTSKVRMPNGTRNGDERCRITPVNVDLVGIPFDMKSVVGKESPKCHEPANWQIYRRNKYLAKLSSRICFKMLNVSLKVFVCLNGIRNDSFI